MILKIIIKLNLTVGKNGMGQAQSQSVGGDCSDCYGGTERGELENLKIKNIFCE